MNPALPNPTQMNPTQMNPTLLNPTLPNHPSGRFLASNHPGHPWWETP